MDDDSLTNPLDAGMRFAFRRRREPGRESVLDSIERLLGSRPALLLSDEADGESPVLLAPSATDPDPVRDDGRYQILGEIARGGVGVVYQGRDRDLGRDVALKVLRSEHADSPDILQRFIEEAQVGGQLQHPGVVPVYSLELQPDGRPCFAMKLVKGRTLAALLEERSSPGENRRHFLGIFEQICQTMAYAHARGVVHRDLKPSNVMIGSFGEVQIVDWGFAKVRGRPERTGLREKAQSVSIIATVRTEEDGSHSVLGSVMGTPAYMPPEQALGQVEDLDERADVFSLGAILTEILTGAPPYVGQGNEPLIMAAQGLLDEAHERLDGCGADSLIVARAKQFMEPLKRDRPRDAGVLAEEIGAYLVSLEERAEQAEIASAEARAKEEEARALLARERLRVETEKARAAEVRRAADRERERQREERRRAVRALVARRRTRILATALVSALLLAAGISIWLTLLVRSRENRAVAAVDRAHREATALAFDNRFEEAMQAAKTTLGYAREAGPEFVSRAQTLLSGIEARKSEADEAAAQEAKDRVFLGALQRIRLGLMVDGHLVLPSLYEVAFREYGLEPLKTAPPETTRLLRAHPDHVAEEIIEALYDWAGSLRRNPDSDSGEVDRLTRAAQAADRDPTRKAIVLAVNQGDRAELLRIGRGWEADRLGVRSLRRLVNALVCDLRTNDSDLRVAGELVLNALREHPGHSLLHSLAGAVAYRDLGRRKSPSTGLSHRLTFRALCPDNAPAWYILRAVPGWWEDTDRMRRTLAAARARGFEEWFLDLDWIDMVARSGDEQEVDRLYEEFRKRNPDVAPRIAPRGSAKTPEATLAAHRRRIRYLPKDLLVRTRYAKALIESGHAEEAEREMRSVLSGNPSHANARHFLGMALFKQGKLRASIREFLKVLELRPDFNGSRAGLGRSYAYLLDFERSIGAFEEAVRWNPKVAQSYLYLAQIHYLQGDLEKGWGYAQRYFALDPEGSSADCLLGFDHGFRGRHTAAIRCYEKLVATEDSFSGRFNLAATLVTVGRYREASRHLKKAKDLACDSPWNRNSRVLDEILAHVERLATIARRVDEIIQGELLPSDQAESLDFAFVCLTRGHQAEAFTFFPWPDGVPQPIPETMSDETLRWLTEFAMRAASIEQGQTEEDRSEWRRRALSSFTLELDRKESGLARMDLEELYELRLELQEWKRDFYFIPVRRQKDLARLPAGERQAWAAVWQRADDLIRRSLEREYQ